MANLINVFPLTIFQDNLTVAPTARARMVEAVLEMGARKMQQSRGSSWTGDLNGYEFLHNDTRFADLFEKFRRPLAGYLEVFGLDPDFLELYYTRTWATISRQGEATREHNHIQSHISLVYYLSKPEDSSGISFVDKDAPNQFAPNLFGERMVKFGVLKEVQQYNTQKFYLDPKQDDVLIFPSKAVHAIAPNRSGEPRISIAADIVVTVKDSEGLEYLYPSLDTWKSCGATSAAAGAPDDSTSEEFAEEVEAGVPSRALSRE